MADKEPPSWQDLAQQVRDRRDDSIDKFAPDLEIPRIGSGRAIPIPRHYLTSAEIAITESSVQSLLNSLAQGKLSATEVTNAFLRRAVIAQKLVS